MMRRKNLLKQGMKNKKAPSVLLPFLVFISSFLFFSHPVNAQENVCSEEVLIIKPLEVVEGSLVEIIFKAPIAPGSYTIALTRNFADKSERTLKVTDETSFPLSYTIKNFTEHHLTDNTVAVHFKGENGPQGLCEGYSDGYLGSYKIISASDFHYSVPEYDVIITGNSNNQNCIDISSTVKINFKNLKRVYNDGSEELVTDLGAKVQLLINSSSSTEPIEAHPETVKNGEFSVTFGPNLPSSESTSLKVLLPIPGVGIPGEYYAIEAANLSFMPIRLVCGAEDDDRSRLTLGPIDLGLYDLCQGN